MQKVEIYYDVLEAKWGMEEYIRNGWRVHICTMSCYESGHTVKGKVLVIYEKSVHKTRILKE